MSPINRGFGGILSEYSTCNSGKQIMVVIFFFLKITQCVFNILNTKTLFFSNKTPSCLLNFRYKKIVFSYLDVAIEDPQVFASNEILTKLIILAQTFNRKNLIQTVKSQVHKF